MKKETFTIIGTSLITTEGVVIERIWEEKVYRFGIHRKVVNGQIDETGSFSISELSTGRYMFNGSTPKKCE